MLFYSFFCGIVTIYLWYGTGVKRLSCVTFLVVWSVNLGNFEEWKWFPQNPLFYTSKRNFSFLVVWPHWSATLHVVHVLKSSLSAEKAFPSSPWIIVLASIVCDRQFYQKHGYSLQSCLSISNPSLLFDPVLPFLERTTIFLYPIGAMFVLFPICK